MKLSDFSYNLPENLIAQEPIEPRDNSRLLIYEKNTNNILEKKFYDIKDYLTNNDVLVINKTKVINARLFWEIDIFPKWKKEIKNVEIFLHKQISNNTWECLWYPGKNLKIWRNIRFLDENKNIIMNWLIKEISKMWRFIEFDKSDLIFLEIIDKLWELPLPPYITKKLTDKNRYQTVYAKESWSVAAPTAWLHFTKELISKLKEKWVIIEEVLLHVWVWTFKPVEVDNIKDHHMHSEYIELDKNVWERLNNYKKIWKNIIAVWTTSVRVLESFCDDNWVLSYWKKDTNIFIYPWYNWKFINSLITNFHLPCSTLLMLVSSLAWKENILNLYNFAVEKKYRFFSFWDAMRIK